MIPSEAFTYLLQGIAFGLTAAAAPGAFQTYLINQTLSGGWRRGATVAFSLALSDPPIVIAILFLLGQLPGSFITGVKLAGGFFALFMAWSLFRGWRKQANKKPYDVPTESGPQENDSNGHSPNTWGVLTRGALMNVLSPGVYTFWGTVLGPLLLEAARQSSAYGLSFLLGFYGTFIGSLLGLALLFHQARRFGARVVRYMTLASILILGVFGVVLILSGV